MQFSTALAAVALLASQSLAMTSRMTALAKDYKFGLSGHTPNGFIGTPQHVEVYPSKATKTVGLSQYGVNVMKKTMKYGPFTVNGYQKNNGMNEMFLPGFGMPCDGSGGCTITSMQGGLEYADGSDANVNTGAWLHHMVLINNDASDTVCNKAYFLFGQRFFATGNERTLIDMSLDGSVPAGYQIPASPNIMSVLELMNMNMNPITVYVTMDYEYVNGHPAALAQVVPAWLDISTCQGFSDVSASGSGVSSYTDSQTWNTNVEGSLIAVGGHLHDGGITLPVSKNGKVLCNIQAKYGQTPQYVSPSGMMGMDMPMTHISEMTACTPPQLGYMNKGEAWTIVANYNGNMHPLMQNSNGSLMSIMGISMIFVAPSISAAQMAKYVKNCSVCKSGRT